MPEGQYKYMLTVTEAAAIFGIGENTLRELIRTDKTLPVIKVGTHSKINSGLFRDWLDKATREGRQINLEVILWLVYER